MQFLKGHPSTLMDDYQLNITSMIKYAAKNFPEREIVSNSPDGMFRYNYKEALARIKRLANALTKLGVKPGDRVGILGWNTHRFFELYFGLAGIGAVLLQMNFRTSREDLAYVTNHSQAKFIFLDDSLIIEAEGIAPSLHTVKGYVIMTDKDMGDIETKLSPVSSFEVLLREAEPEFDWPMIDETSAFTACYTSGTTGKPKGVYYSHRGVYLVTMAYALKLGASCRDNIMQIPPLFHANGWGLIFIAASIGAKIVLPGRFEIDNIGPLVELMINEGITYTPIPPAIFMPILNYAKGLEKKPHFPQARFQSGATEPPLAMMKEWKELTEAKAMFHAYGATETSPLATFNELKPDLEQQLSEHEKWELLKKQGFPVMGVDLEIVDENGQELPWDGISSGEILLRGPWITGSYYNDPRTAEAFSGGYWRSGDSATVDSHGYVKLIDRIKDLIKSGGEWISSVDLENAIMGYSKVFEATVVGVYHPKWEERPLALVVVKKDFSSKVTKEEVINFIVPKFAKWQLPDDIVFLSEIPKTSVGKFNKKLLREEYRNYLVNRGTSEPLG